MNAINKKIASYILKLASRILAEGKLHTKQEAILFEKALKGLEEGEKFWDAQATKLKIDDMDNSVRFIRESMKSSERASMSKMEKTRADLLQKELKKIHPSDENKEIIAAMSDVALMLAAISKMMVMTGSDFQKMYKAFETFYHSASKQFEVVMNPNNKIASKLLKLASSLIAMEAAETLTTEDKERIKTAVKALEPAMEFWKEKFPRDLKLNYAYKFILTAIDSSASSREKTYEAIQQGSKISEKMAFKAYQTMDDKRQFDYDAHVAVHIAILVEIAGRMLLSTKWLSEKTFREFNNLLKSVNEGIQVSKLEKSSGKV